MAIGKCLKCDSIGQMTQDHVVPAWFIKLMINFGVKELPQNNIELICQKCNSKKGGTIDYSHEPTRSMVKLMVESILLQIRNHESEYKP